MKLPLLLVVSALVLGGCIVQPPSATSATAITAATATSTVTTSVELERTRYLALAYIAKNSTDASTKHMAVMALALAAPR